MIRKNKNSSTLSKTNLCSYRPTRNRNGFTLIEVLIATVILVIAIVTASAALKQFTITRERLKSYEHLYTTALSVKDLILNDKLSNGLEKSGTLNGLDYRYECSLQQSAKNYVYGEDEASSGNWGAYTILLYKVTLTLSGKTFEIYKTDYKKSVADTAKSESNIKLSPEDI